MSITLCLLLEEGRSRYEVAEAVLNAYLYSGISHSLLQVKPKSICKVVVAFLQLALTISLSTNHPLEKKK